MEAVLACFVVCSSTAPCGVELLFVATQNSTKSQIPAIWVLAGLIGGFMGDTRSLDYSSHVLDNPCPWQPPTAHFFHAGLFGLRIAC